MLNHDDRKSSGREKVVATRSGRQQLRREFEEFQKEDDDISLKFQALDDLTLNTLDRMNGDS